MDVGTDSFRRQIRSCATIRAYSLLFRLGSLKVRDQATKMYELFHGTESIYGQIQQLLDRKGPYAGLFEEKVSVVIDSTPASNTAKHVLRSDFLFNKEYVLGTNLLVKERLECTGMDPKTGLVPGRTLMVEARDCMLNMKKALAVLGTMPEVDQLTSTGVVYKSGNSEEEVKLKLLQLMYTELVYEKEKTKEKVVSTERPSDWYFKGWVAFCVFGPFVDEEQRLPLIEVGSTKEDTKVENGRKATREKEKNKEKDFVRLNDNVHEKGLSLNNRLQMDALDLKSKEIGNQKKNRQLTALLGTIQCAERSYARALDLAKQFCPQPDRENEEWKEVFEIKAELKRLNAELNENRNAAESPVVPVSLKYSTGSTLLQSSPAQTPLKKKSKTIQLMAPVKEVTVNGSEESVSELHFSSNKEN